MTILSNKCRKLGKCRRALDHLKMIKMHLEYHQCTGSVDNKTTPKWRNIKIKINKTYKGMEGTLNFILINFQQLSVPGSMLLGMKIIKINPINSFPQETTL